MKLLHIFLFALSSSEDFMLRDLERTFVQLLRNDTASQFFQVFIDCGEFGGFIKLRQKSL